MEQVSTSIPKTTLDILAIRLKRATVSNSKEVLTFPECMQERLSSLLNTREAELGSVRQSLEASLQEAAAQQVAGSSSSMCEKL